MLRTPLLTSANNKQPLPPRPNQRLDQHICNRCKEPLPCIWNSPKSLFHHVGARWPQSLDPTARWYCSPQVAKTHCCTISLLTASLLLLQGFCCNYCYCCYHTTAKSTDRNTATLRSDTQHNSHQYHCHSIITNNISNIVHLLSHAGLQQAW